MSPSPVPFHFQSHEFHFVLGPDFLLECVFRTSLSLYKQLISLSYSHRRRCTPKFQFQLISDNNQSSYCRLHCSSSSFSSPKFFFFFHNLEILISKSSYPREILLTMALRMAILRNAGPDKSCSLGFQRWAHAISQPTTLHSPLDHFCTTSSLMVLPEAEISNENPNFSFIHGSMELMAVPKKKVSPHKRGIHNGPKALKPVPVIVRCMVCGKIKLPHFFCCGGKPKSDGQNGSVC